MANLQITYASEPAPETSNEDRVRAGDEWAIVLDGAGRYPGRTGGCVHPVTWVVEHLAGHLAAQLSSPRSATLPLTTVLSDAIQLTMDDHGPTCDLSDPLSPGAAVAILRTAGPQIEWLVLADCAVAVEGIDGEIAVVVDDRVDHLPNAPVVEGQIKTYDPDYVATVRNRPGGFWVASSVPEAAHEALTGAVPIDQVARVLMCSDGVSRLVERHRWTWPQVFDVAGDRGPHELIDEVRRADADDPNAGHYRGKIHDDATVALCLLASQGV